MSSERSILDLASRVQLELLAGLRVLVVEDIREHQLVLREALQAARCRVEVVDTIATARHAIAEEDPDIIVLDVLLPDGSANDLLVDLRASTDAYLLILSALNGTIDRVTALASGADDYLGKPFAPAELVARLVAGQRRVGRGVTRAPNDGARWAEGSDEVLNVGIIEFHRAAHRVSVEGNEVDLTLREFQLLDQLLQHRGRALSRGQLVDLVWGADWFGDPRVVDTHVNNLRRKLRDAGGSDPLITVRGVGYRID